LSITHLQLLGHKRHSLFDRVPPQHTLIGGSYARRIPTLTGQCSEPLKVTVYLLAWELTGSALAQ
jgi:hypothetical protein